MINRGRQLMAKPLGGIITFLVLTFGFSSVFYRLIIHAGHTDALQGLLIMGLMWCPAISAIITCKLRGQSLRDLGWHWNSRYQLFSYLIPLAYTGITYGIVWATKLGGFPNRNVLTMIAKNAGWTTAPSWLVLAGYIVVVGTIGMVQFSMSALGEEIGWRGFLVPELAKTTSFTPTALISGGLWAAWHAPLILFGDYTSSTPKWYSLTCFTVMIIGISFVFTWMRLRSGSVWTAVFLHASHNLFIQAILNPLTTNTGRTDYVIDEFGAGLAIAAVLVALVCWKYRSALPNTHVALATDSPQQQTTSMINSVSHAA